jgi:hypothetical protein
MAYGFTRIKFSFRIVSFLLFVVLLFCFLFALHGAPPIDDVWSRKTVTLVAKLRSPTSPLRFHQRAPPELEHGYLANGLLETNLGAKHPMLELIEQAERKRNALVKR